MVKRAPRRQKKSFHQLDWRLVRNRYKPAEFLSEDEIERIHDASLGLLENMGMEFMSDEALDTLAAAGADVDRSNGRVRFDRGLILESVAKAPSQFTMHARNPGKSYVVGGDHMAFCAIGSAPNCSDLDNGRRPGCFEDYRNLIKLTQSLNIIHAIGGYPVEPIDLPGETRHLDCVREMLIQTDKSIYAYSLGATRVNDAVEMATIAFGVDREELKNKPVMFSVINTNSPLKVDGPMLEGLKAMALAGQPVCITPFTLSGAMSPVTLAGALMQQNAEALAVIAYQQIVAPGAPVIFGGFTTNVDMRSGAPAFGTPEYLRAAQIGGQLARRYNLPYRSSNTTAANAVDPQATYESMMSIWGAVTGGVNLMKHAAGWMEGGLCASFEKMVIDAEMLQMISEIMLPIPVDDDSLGLEAIEDVGPGGHFFGTQHTMERYETAFYTPLVSDWSNFGTWQENGSVTAERRANAIYKELLADFEAPPTNPAVAEALDDYVERRKREIEPEF